MKAQFCLLPARSLPTRPFILTRRNRLALTHRPGDRIIDQRSTIGTQARLIKCARQCSLLTCSPILASIGVISLVALPLPHVRRFAPKSAHHQWKGKTMHSKISHIQFNVQAANLAFYTDLLAFAGLQTLYEGEDILGVGDENETSMWFSASAKDVANDYDGPGMNHLALEVPAQSDVDAAVAYLTERGVPVLFGTPRHNPEFSSAERTYYQVMFESPDRILFEIVYMGPKAD